MAAPIEPANENKSSIRKEMAIRHVINDLINGGVYSVVRTKLIEDEYGIGYKYKPGTAKEIIKFARKRIKEDFEEQLPEIKANLSSILMDIITESKEIGDRHAAIKAVQEVAKLTGAYSPQQIEAKVENYVIDFKLDGEDEENTN